MTLKLPRQLLRDASVVASGQDVTVGHLVRVLLAREVERRLDPKTSNRADGGLVAALQALLARDLAAATDWGDLAERLRPHGYELRPAGGGLAVYKSSCGTKVCKGSEVGFAYRTLVRRFRAAMPGHPHGTLGEDFTAPPLDRTTKGRLQRALEPLFKTAPDWETLTARLAKSGYSLRPMGAGLAIYTTSGSHVCNTATVGYRYRALVKKFNCPMPGHAHGQRWLKHKETGAGQHLPPDADPDFHVIEPE